MKDTNMTRMKLSKIRLLAGSVMGAAIALVVFPPVAWAQIGGPVLGYVPVGESIRPVYGVPAAASVMSPIDPGQPVALMAISPHQDYVFGTDASTGAALLILPGVSTATLDAVGTGPDSITMSPSGSAVVLWWNSVTNFQVVGGLPDAPSVLRTVSTNFLSGAPTALAVSDDGQWVAGIWSTGVYAFGPDGQVNQLPVQGAASLAFFHGQPNLAVASATQISTVTDVGGAAAVSVIYDTTPLPDAAPMSPLAVALSFDNKHVVVADASGTIVHVPIGTGTFTTVNCACTPQGLFGMNGTVFRLTDLSPRAMTLFDAATDEVDIVPLATRKFTWSRIHEHGPAVHLSVPSGRAINSGGAIVVRPLAANLPAAPSVTVTPTTSTVAQQPPVTVSISPAYPVDISGTITLTFTPSVGVGDNPLIAFSTGGRTVDLFIPAGATKAALSAPSSSQVTNVALLTGTVAGTITLTTTLTAQGVPLSPQPAPVQIVINTTPPVIQSVTISEPPTGNVLTVVVTGFSDTRDMTSGLFHFAPTSGRTFTQSDITVPLTSAFATWYQNAASNAFGSAFTLTVPFTVQGPSLSVLAVTVTLTNSKGTSNPSNPANP